MFHVACASKIVLITPEAVLKSPLTTTTNTNNNTNEHKKDQAFVSIHGMSRQQSRHRRSQDNGSNSHLIGTSVSVIQKQDQGTGQLTSGTIAEILTNSTFHPRGIKVRLVDGTVGRISDNSPDGAGLNSHSNSDDHDRNNDAVPLPSHSLADYLVAPVPPTQNIITQNTEHHNVDWPCPMCTFLNSGLLPECELCQTKRVT